MREVHVSQHDAARLFMCCCELLPLVVQLRMGKVAGASAAEVNKTAKILRLRNTIQNLAQVIPDIVLYRFTILTSRVNTIQMNVVIVVGIVFVIQEWVAWTSTLITHKHSKHSPKKRYWYRYWYRIVANVVTLL